MIDMNARVIFENDEGGVSVLIPCECGLTIEQIAQKDVPAGKPYRIVDVSDLPNDRADRAKWTIDATLLTDGVGADYGVGSDLEVVDILPNGDFVLRRKATEPPVVKAALPKAATILTIA